MVAFEVKDKVFFITGGASGIGVEVAKIVVAEGAKRVVIFDFNEKVGVAVQNELNAKYGGDKVKFIKGDVTNEDQFLGCLNLVKKDIGLDVLINNAGIMNDCMDKYKKAIEINVVALITGTLHAIKLMRKSEGGNGGTVINISSVAGLSRADALPVYFATKSAVLQFSNCIGLADNYERTGVRVLTICFGRTDTGLLHNIHSFDEEIDCTLDDLMASYPIQTPQSAARGLVDVYKAGTSGSTWLVNANRPAQDISGNIKKAYEIMSQGIYE